MDKEVRHHLRTGLVVSAALFVLFGLFTAAVMLYDVAPVGIDGSSMGFSCLNVAFHDRFPSDETFYNLTEWLGYLALGIAGGVGLMALLDLIQKKSLLKMERKYLVTCIFYAVVIAFYVLFELFVVNLRPIEAEASYPSSHTVLALCVFSSACILLGQSRFERSIAGICKAVMIGLMVVMVVGRLLCGVHWLTDIVGGVLLSASLVCFYRAFFRAFCD